MLKVSTVDLFGLESWDSDKKNRWTEGNTQGAGYVPPLVLDGDFSSRLHL